MILHAVAAVDPSVLLDQTHLCLGINHTTVRLNTVRRRLLVVNYHVEILIIWLQDTVAVAVI
jgi:hypothetical protein